MPLIDERGRLFGRWNLIDALVRGAIVLFFVLFLVCVALVAPLCMLVGWLTSPALWRRVVSSSSGVWPPPWLR